MPPAKCSGYVQNGVTQECIFNPQKQRAKALAKAEGQCVVCNVGHMAHMCATGQLRGCLMHHLRRMRELDASVFDVAMGRVPVAWRMHVARGRLR